jgi:hypothetical protein
MAPEPAETAPGEEPTRELPQRRPFAAWLQEQRDGGLNAELSDAMAEVVSAVVDQEKQGTVTLKVTVAPVGDGGGNQVLISDEVKVAPPEPPRPKKLFFADSSGNVSRRDPRQNELPGLRRVGGEKE